MCGFVLVCVCVGVCGVGEVREEVGRKERGVMLLLSHRLLLFIFTSTFTFTFKLQKRFKFTLTFHVN